MLIEMLKKHGASKTIVEKVRSGTFFYDVVSTLINGTDKTSLELTRLGEINRAKKKLKKKYWSQIVKPLPKYDSLTNSDYVWTLWLQGEAQAPAIVKTALSSIKRVYSQVVVLDGDNFQHYAKLPDFIIQKWHSGEISNAHFSDILRTELLVEHGGIWIDSTALISHKSDWLDNQIADVPLFFFQNLRPGSMGNAIFLSSWFIKAQKGEPTLIRLRELLYEYWNTSHKAVDYFIYHILWHLIFEAHPENLRSIPRVSNSLPLEMMYRLNDSMNLEEIREIFTRFPIQKVTYKSLSENPNAAHVVLESSFREVEN